MNKDKVAILVDSCADVPKELIQRYGMYTIPLSIIYKDAIYADGVDITTKEVYENFDVEIPRTSLPTRSTILDIFESIASDGYKKVLAVTMSGSLSGTYNAVRLSGEDFEGLDVFVVDTKNVSLGSGMAAIAAAENLEKGFSWEELKKLPSKVLQKVKFSFVFPACSICIKGEE